MFEKLKYFSTIFFGTFIIAVGVYFFMNPNHIVSGSISGLAVVLVNFVPLSLSAMTLFLFVDKAFGTKIIFISILLPALLFVFELLFPGPVSPTGNIALDVVAMIIVICYGQAVLFNANAASGGLDIIAKIMNKYLHMDLGKSIIIAGLVTVASSYFAYDLQTVIIGALSTYLSGLVLDYFIDEFTGKIRVCVISEHNDDFKRYVIETLQRGITVYTATGGYSDAQKEEILAILTKKEYGQFMDYVQTKDPNAFVTISNVKRVVGSWNTPKRRTYF